MSMQNNQPVKVLRDDPLKASIWENKGEKGGYLSAKFTKTYSKDGELHDTTVFNRSDLLTLSELAKQAYSKMGTLRKKVTQPEGDVSTLTNE